MGAHIRILHDQVKVAEIDSELGKCFEVQSDEPPNLGGDDEFPQPLREQRRPTVALSAG